MSSYQDHLNKAQLNDHFANHFDLDSTPYKDWAVVGSFYAAIHYVEAYLAKSGLHPCNHSDRETIMGSDKKLDAIFWKSYRDLKTFRYWASYKTHHIFSAQEIKNDVFLALMSIKVSLKGLGVSIKT